MNTSRKRGKPGQKILCKKREMSRKLHLHQQFMFLLKQFGTANECNFERAGDQMRRCYTCHMFAERKLCGAFKRVEFHIDENYALVFHASEHLCTLDSPRRFQRGQLISKLKAAGNTDGVGPKEFTTDHLLKRIESGDVDGFH